MSPLEKYKIALLQPGFLPDSAQEMVIGQFQALFERLTTPEQYTGRMGQWLSRFRKPEVAPPTGLYVWGGVGRGKTHLFDLFYDCLPFEDKLRLHFHRFMELIHSRLNKYPPTPDPIDLVARDLAYETRVLCLDEMQVTDITDAMIIHGLLRGLFERGVTLVTTSNVPPDDLYKNGLQRARFLPAIELIKAHTQVTEMVVGEDYRLRTLERAEIYHTPLDELAQVCLETNFRDLVAVARPKTNTIRINRRKIPVVRWADGIAWFNFSTICSSPRSKNDYIEIARYFHTVLVGQIPELNDQHNDQARRFINMIDEFYDRNVKFIASAEVHPEHLYAGKRLSFEFQRTASRLTEMQSHDYLARKHLP